MSLGAISFELQLGPLGAADLLVSRVSGREALSEPYAFEVELARRDRGPLDLAALVGAEAELRLHRPSGEARVVHGEAWRVELTGVAAGAGRYRAWLGPRLLRLGRVERSRLFQGRSVPQIVEAVLGEHGVAHRSALAGQYQPREYVAQYRESDLAFVSRLLEAEGIWYRFEHAAGKHELVLADGESGQARRAGEVPVRHETGQGGDAEHVSRLARTHRATTEAVERRDYDFERPALALTARAGAAGGPEVYEWPGGFLDGPAGRERAARQLEALRHGRATLAGEGTCLDVQPGTAFALAGHGRVLAVRVTHQGEQELGAGAATAITASYRNEFQGIAADQPYRPRRRSPRPRIAGVQTATVVGPAGEEIQTDQHGRIKVQLHWDREGKRDDASSCWIRVAQAWAGAGMGASFLPRIGQEVVIRYLEGDPDRPVVTGAVYNGRNPPPVELPRDRTRSTTRSDSSPGGGGSNELAFEDLAGGERIDHHAERDQHVVVEDAHRREVRHIEGLAVAEDRTKRVLGWQRLAVQQDDQSGVGGLQTLAVARERETQVAGSQAEQVGALQTVTVGQAQEVSVGMASSVLVGAAAALGVGAGYAVSVGGAIQEAVAGLKSSQVGGASIEVVGAHREERVAGKRESTTQGAAQAQVDGRALTKVDGDSTERVDGKVQIRVAEPHGGAYGEADFQADKLTIAVGGKVALSMEKSGAVTISGANLTIEEG